MSNCNTIFRPLTHIVPAVVEVTCQTEKHTAADSAASAWVLGMVVAWALRSAACFDNRAAVVAEVLAAGLAGS